MRYIVSGFEGRREVMDTLGALVVWLMHICTWEGEDE
jgi:hypothetical protein